MAALLKPWLVKNLLVAEPEVKYRPKVRRVVQIVSFTVFQTTDHPRAQIQAWLSDGKHCIIAGFDLAHTDDFQASSQTRLTEHKGAMVQLKTFKFFKQTSKRGGRVGLLIYEFALLGGSGEAVVGSPLDIETDPQTQSWLTQGRTAPQQGNMTKGASRSAADDGNVLQRLHEPNGQPLTPTRKRTPSPTKANKKRMTSRSPTKSPRTLKTAPPPSSPSVPSQPLLVRRNQLLWRRYDINTLVEVTEQPAPENKVPGSPKGESHAPETQDILVRASLEGSERERTRDKSTTQLEGEPPTQLDPAEIVPPTLFAHAVPTQPETLRQVDAEADQSSEIDSSSKASEVMTWSRSTSPVAVEARAKQGPARTRPGPNHENGSSHSSIDFTAARSRGSGDGSFQNMYGRTAPADTTDLSDEYPLDLPQDELITITSDAQDLIRSSQRPNGGLSEVDQVPSDPAAGAVLERENRGETVPFDGRNNTDVGADADADTDDRPSKLKPEPSERAQASGSSSGQNSPSPEPDYTSARETPCASPIRPSPPKRDVSINDLNDDMDLAGELPDHSPAATDLARSRPLMPRLAPGSKFYALEQTALRTKRPELSLTSFMNLVRGIGASKKTS